MKINQVSEEEFKNDIFAARINHTIKNKWRWHIPDFQVKEIKQYHTGLYEF